MAIQICRSFTKLELEGEFLKRLSAAKSNIPELGDGKEAYLRFVQPSIVDLRRVIAHYAISSLFEKFSKHTLIEVVRALDQHFGSRYYTLKDLFIEERRKVLSLVMAETLGRFKETYHRLYEENRKLMGYLKGVEAPLPEAFVIAAKYVLKVKKFSRGY